MGHKKSTRLIIASLIFLIVASVSVYFLIRDNGHKKSEELVELAEQPTDTLILREMFSFKYDLESAADLENFATVGKFKSKSGTQSCRLDKSNEFSVTVRKKLSSLKDISNVKNVRLSFSVYSGILLKEAVAVLSIEDKNGKSVSWVGKEIKSSPESWQRIEISFDISTEALQSENDLKIYIWNKKGEEFYIDDLEIKIDGLVSSKSYSSGYIPERNVFENFEVPVKNENPDHYSKEHAHTGVSSFLLTNGVSYSPSVSRRISEVIDSELRLVTMSIWVNQQTDDNELVLVATIKDTQGKDYFWQGRSTEKGFFPKGIWTKHRAQFKLPFEKIKPEDIISIYAWNKGGKDVFVDDFQVVFGETNVRSGAVPLIDLASNGDVAYSFVPNKAPYQTKFLSRFVPSGTDSNKDFDLISDVLYPSDLYCSGNFVIDAVGRDQLAHVSEDGNLALYSYCEPENKMKKVFTSSVKNMKSSHQGSILKSGNFFNKEKDQLLFIDLKSHCFVVGQFPPIRDNCNELAPKSNFKILGELTGENFTKLISSNYNECVIANFIGDDKSECFFMNQSSGNYLMLGFNDNQIIKLAEGNSNILKVSDSGHTYQGSIPGISGDHDLLCLSESGEGFKKICLSITTTHNNELNFHEKESSWLKLASGKFYFGQFTNSTNEILVLNRDWKFDLSYGQLQGNGVFIKANVDFEGFSNGYNPKYYEDIKIVPGNFIKSDRTALLVFCGNCIDNTFPILNCKNYDNKSDWKPGAEIYYFKD
ncbi:MAG: hypothetical protein IPN13_05755 [Bacteroidetes bacterium]|nr:hypothetical protein [Bacteroidota bacterium]